MHVDIDTPRSDLLAFSGIWSNNNTNLRSITQQDAGAGVIAASSAEEYAVTLQCYLCSPRRKAKVTREMFTQKIL